MLLIATVAISISACKKTEVLQTAQISDYAPLVTGKYITYQLDSLVIVNFGRKDTIISYQVKFVIDSLIKDNLNRPAYRVFRYIRKDSTTSWATDNTFLYVNTGTSLEFIEDNHRFLKLVQPIKNGNSWKGNTYIDTYSLLSDVKYLDDWDYVYDIVNASLTLPGITLENTLKIAERDEIIGNPGDVNSYSETNYSAEIYAKDIGLVYRRFLHEEYQPPATMGGQGYFADGSYGITLTMIDHN